MLSCSAGLSSTTSSRLRRGARVFLDAGERRVQAFGRGRLGHEGECAARQAVMPVLIQGQHLHRDVARGRILLQMVQHGPAQHVGQEHIQRDGGGMVLARQRQRFGAAHRDQHLEALVAREIAENARVVRIVFDDQQDGIARLQIVAIVCDALDRLLRQRRSCRQLQRRRSRLTFCLPAVAGADGPDVGLRQVEREGAALARRAAQLNFAAQQAGQFAADGQAQAGAAVLAAGAGIRLLEGLEDDALLFGGNADAGVGDLERNDRRRAAENRMVCAPAAAWPARPTAARRPAR